MWPLDVRSHIYNSINVAGYKHSCSYFPWKNGEVDVQLSLFGLLLLTQPLHSSEQHTRANLEFSSNFDKALAFGALQNMAVHRHEFDKKICDLVLVLHRLKNH